MEGLAANLMGLAQCVESYDKRTYCILNQSLDLPRPCGKFRGGYLYNCIVPDDQQHSQMLVVTTRYTCNQSGVHVHLAWHEKKALIIISNNVFISVNLANLVSYMIWVQFIKLTIIEICYNMICILVIPMGMDLAGMCTILTAISGNVHVFRALLCFPIACPWKLIHWYSQWHVCHNANEAALNHISKRDINEERYEWLSARKT